MKMFHVEPPFELKLSNTTVPVNTGVVEPDSVVGCPSVCELGLTLRVMEEVVRNCAVRVCGEFIETEKEGLLPTLAPSKFQ